MVTYHFCAMAQLVPGSTLYLSNIIECDRAIKYDTNDYAKVRKIIKECMDIKEDIEITILSLTLI